MFDGCRDDWEAAETHDHRIGSIIAAALAVLLLGAALANAQDVPNPALTPGQVCVTELPTLCNTRWGHDARAVSDAMKQRVFASYGISKAQQRLPNGKPAYEIDHLASRENGGCDAIPNLWPQPYVGTWTARMKDKLENRLHVEMCASKITPAEAVRALVQDWRIAYCARYSGQPCPP